MRLIFLLSMVALGFVSCGDEEEEEFGQPIGAPEVTPPVDRNTPDGLETFYNSTPKNLLVQKTS